MSLSADISAGFQQLNVPLTPQILEKCLQLCTTYSLDAEDLLDQWCAYTASNLNGAAPTVSDLEKMERRELQQQKNPPKPQPRPEPVEARTPPRRKPTEAASPQAGASAPRYDTPSQKFTGRSDSRRVQASFGAPTDFAAASTEQLELRVLNADMAGAQYMYEKFSLRREALDSLGCLAASHILAASGLQLTKQGFECAGEMVVAGRIYPLSGDRIAPKAALFEGLASVYAGQTIQASLEKLPDFSVFTGQTVVLRGLNVNRARFIVDELHSSAPPQPSPPFASFEPLQLVIAAGPFTLPENLLYEPLADLLEYVAESKPNYLILLGPLLDAAHAHLGQIAQSYDDIFESIVAGIAHKLDGAGVRVVLVPSPRDAHGHVVFPTPPYQREPAPGVTLAPNPAVLSVGGLLVAVSTADVLLHLSRAELHRGRGPRDRMARLARHLLHQRCFYPLHPPDADLPVDYQLLDMYGTIEVLPHLLILPSTLRFFVKEVDGCVVINPERLSKGQFGGTFARVEVRPGVEPVCERISCQVLRV